MNQNFTAEQLIKYCKKSEFIDYDVSKEALYKQLEKVALKISENKFEFTIRKDKDYFLTDLLTDKLVLRKLNDNIRKIYKDRQSNRKIIIKQIKTLLEDECDIWLLRTDISKFYESIDRNRLFDKFKSDSMLSFFSMQLIQKIFLNECVKDISGLPRGITLSAVLSEIYMRKVDRWIRGITGVYYYARFVDDLIIFSHKPKIIQTINQNLNEKLQEFNLTKNRSKTKIIEVKTISAFYPLEFLGYKFSFKTIGRAKQLEVSIAKNKISKIKTRIVLSFKTYIQDHEFNLLENRIKFLSSNYKIRSSIDGTHLKAGIFYNYNYVNDFSCFDELDTFLKKIITAKRNPFGISLSALLDKAKIKSLIKYSFKHGFEKKIENVFSIADLSKIKQSWR